MALKAGDPARLVQPVIQGEIAQVKFNEDTGEKRLLLRWEAEDGMHERWFTEVQLEPIAV